jgi:ABC-type metal ion transport system substrate-binding protein
VSLLFIERSSELLLAFLDKHERTKLSRLSVAWNTNVASFNLFSTIVKSIKEVVQEESKANINISTSSERKKATSSSTQD